MAADAKTIRPLRVLFVGNSYIFVNDLPAMIKALAAGRQSRPLEYVINAPGGCTLQRHWESTGVRKQIAQGRWDFVVLQEQSQMPFVRTEVFQKFAALLAKDVSAAGATPLFYQTWARKNAPQTQEALTREYTAAAASAGAAMAAVGEAFATCRSRHPDIELFQGDGSHPTVAGTYLAACVFYRMLYNADPRGLPARLSSAGKSVANLGQPQAQALQAVAWQATHQTKSSVIQPTKEK
ncbi:MAG: hypothetical protein LLG01_19105 [Planctomycetaceae bacterium]|nr:hypothetical protein [Planctomycetaceae bacterium]